LIYTDNPIRTPKNPQNLLKLITRLKPGFFYSPQCCIKKGRFSATFFVLQIKHLGFFSSDFYFAASIRFNAKPAIEDYQ
jgi:hypothetical protein